MRAERLHAEALLRESENRYAILYENMSVGVIYQGADGQVTDMNPAAERILGVGRYQIISPFSINANLKTIHMDGSEFPAEEHPKHGFTEYRPAAAQSGDGLSISLTRKNITGSISTLFLSSSKARPDHIRYLSRLMTLQIANRLRMRSDSLTANWSSASRNEHLNCGKPRRSLFVKKNWLSLAN